MGQSALQFLRSSSNSTPSKTESSSNKSAADFLGIAKDSMPAASQTEAEDQFANTKQVKSKAFIEDMLAVRREQEAAPKRTPSIGPATTKGTPLLDAAAQEKEVTKTEMLLANLPGGKKFIELLDLRSEMAKPRDKRKNYETDDELKQKYKQLNTPEIKNLIGAGPIMYALEEANVLSNLAQLAAGKIFGKEIFGDKKTQTAKQSEEALKQDLLINNKTFKDAAKQIVAKRTEVDAGLIGELAIDPLNFVGLKEIKSATNMVKNVVGSGSKALKNIIHKADKIDDAAKALKKTFEVASEKLPATGKAIEQAGKIIPTTTQEQAVQTLAAPIKEESQAVVKNIKQRMPKVQQKLDEIYRTRDALAEKHSKIINNATNKINELSGQIERIKIDQGANSTIGNLEVAKINDKIAAIKYKLGNYIKRESKKLKQIETKADEYEYTIEGWNNLLSAKGQSPFAILKQKPQSVADVIIQNKSAIENNVDITGLRALDDIMPGRNYTTELPGYSRVLPKTYNVQKGLPSDIAALKDDAGGIVGYGINDATRQYAPIETIEYPFIDGSAKKSVAERLGGVSHNAMLQDGGVAGPITKMHFDAESNIATRNNFVADMAEIINSSAKKYGIRTTSGKQGKRITAILEQIGSDDVGKSVPEILAKLKGKYKLNEAGFAIELRQFLDSTRDIANHHRVKYGKELIGFVDNYVSSMKRSNSFAETVRESFEAAWTGTNGKVSAPDFIVPNAKLNPNALRRTGELLEKDKEKNIFKILNSYIENVANDIYLTPVIGDVKAHMKVMEHRKLYNIKNYWDDWTRNLVGEPSGGIIKRGANWLNTVRNRAVLLGNYLWMLKTNPASVANTIAHTGWKNTFLGFADYITNKELRKEIQDTIPSFMLKTGSDSMGINATNRIGRKLYTSKRDLVNDVLNVPLAAMERFLHGGSTAAGLRYGKELGYKGKELKAFANYIAERTQTMSHPAARAKIFNEVWARSLFPYNTWAAQMATDFSWVLGNKVGHTAPVKKRFMAMMSGIAAMTAYNYYTQEVYGQKLTTIGSMIPFAGPFIDKKIQEKADRAIPGGRSEMAPVQFGSDIFDAVTAMGELASAVSEAGSEKDYDIKYMSEKARDYLMSGDAKALRTFLSRYGTSIAGLAGGTTVNNIVEGIISNKVGYQSKKGKVLFKQESSTDKILAPILGPTSTPSARKYFDKRKGKGSTDSKVIHKLKKKKSDSILKDLIDSPLPF